MDWVETLSVIWSSRKLIVLLSIAATVGAIIVSLLLPEYYRSTATLLPETEKGKLAALGGLSDLAALAGVSVGGEGSLAKMYPTILRSEAVLRNVIYAEYRSQVFPQPTNLVQYWEIEEATPEREYEIALRILRDGLEISFDNKTSIVTIALETRDPVLSAAIVNNITKQLDEFIRTKRTTNAGEQRKWIDDRLQQVKGDLEKAENVLRAFREKNRRVSDSPQLMLEQGRLLREVEINSTLYTELKKQLEIAKIEEIKNIPIINVMDSARAASRRERPKRAVIVLSTLVVSTIFGMGLVVVLNRYDQVISRILGVFLKRKRNE